MAHKDFFDKKRGRAPQRKHDIRTPKPNSFLIVSEGEKTEPLYFGGLAQYINKKYGNSIDVKPTITSYGRGRSTVSLVNETERIVAQAKIIYSQIWVVFDKDDFIDFDKAISLANKLDYKVAWSNQSFEYWIFLHFSYADSALGRDDWEEKINDIFRKRKIDPNGYHKNDPEIFTKATQNGNLGEAVRHAAKIESMYEPDLQPSLCNPCTKVHHLIRELAPYIRELL